MSTPPDGSQPYEFSDSLTAAVDTLIAAGIHWVTALNAVAGAARCDRAGEPQLLGRWQITYRVPAHRYEVIRVTGQEGTP